MADDDPDSSSSSIDDSDDSCYYPLPCDSLSDTESDNDIIPGTPQPTLHLLKPAGGLFFQQPNTTPTAIEIRPIDLTPETNSINETALTSSTKKQLSRKRKRDPKSWKCNKRKMLCEAGKEYTNVRNQNVPAKGIKILKDCVNVKNCKYKCASKITDEERNNIFKHFYELDFIQKRSFILNSTESYEKNNKKKTRRAKTFSYSFVVGGRKIKVCKKYFLGTLDISQKVIYTTHLKKNPVTGTPSQDGRGKHAKKKYSEDDKKAVIDHINSFPRIESHYCRNGTKKEYLQSGLSLNKMFDLYVEYCSDNNKEPVKISFYRYIFNTDFNINFHIPRKDRCDLCESVKVAREQKTVTENEENNYHVHIQNKNAMRMSAENDVKDNSVDVIISFDLQNVISLPRADISSFFYKRKLNVYNLTGYSSKNKQGYCAIWSENMSGRAGNDIASAFIKILEKVTEADSSIKNITTWCDSCVPQNKNSIISYAVYYFLNTHPEIESVTMKFSVPGHSCVQVVDNMHSQIEKILRTNEVFSPIGLIRILKTVNRKKPFVIIQMRPNDFKDFKSCVDFFNFKNVPFSKAFVLKFTKAPQVECKLSHVEASLQNINIRKEKKTRLSPKEIVQPTQTFLPEPKVAKSCNNITEAKKSDLKDMMKFMSVVDCQFYATIV